VEKIPSVDAWPIWNYQDGQLIRVVCYTNARQAKLLLNEKEVGAVQKYNDETGIIYWDIPYRAGTLKVIGMDAAGNEISSYEIRSSQRPQSLKIVSGEQTITKDEVVQIVVQVVDENSVPVMLSDDEVTCRIIGNARLLGLEASNNSDMTDYTDNIQRVFHGRILAILKPTGQVGDEIRVRFTSPWLEPAETTLRIN
jgi:hypothetical protein